MLLILAANCPVLAPMSRTVRMRRFLSQSSRLSGRMTRCEYASSIPHGLTIRLVRALAVLLSFMMSSCVALQADWSGAYWAGLLLIVGAVDDDVDALADLHAGQTAEGVFQENSIYYHYQIRPGLLSARNSILCASSRSQCDIENKRTIAKRGIYGETKINTKGLVR